MKIKNILNTIKDEFACGGHLTSVGAMSVVLLTMIFLEREASWIFLVVAFLGTEIIYSYNRYKEFAKNNPWRTNYLKSRIKFIPLFIFLYTIISLWLLIYLEKINILLFGVFLIVLGLFYSIYVKKITKKIIGFKNFFVSFCWASIVLFSALLVSYPIDLTVIIIFFFVYFNTFVYEIILDVRDIKEDKRDKLLTLPIILNKKQLNYLIFLLSIIPFVLIVFGVYFTVLPSFSVVLVFTILYNIYISRKINQICKKDIKYLEIFIDLGRILWFIQIFTINSLL